MVGLRWLIVLLAGGATLLGGPAPAQNNGNVQPATASPDIVVTGARARPSGWRQAETSHVIVLSDGSEAELVRLTRNLERLHFLLSGLLGRTDAADDTVKIRITLIGDVAAFENMDLRNRRWQQGPFNDLFKISRFYDPREDGAVMAVTRVDQQTVIEHSQAASPEAIQSAIEGLSLNQPAGERMAAEAAVIGDFATSGLRGPNDWTIGTGAKTIPISAEGLLYAGYAQHYLLTYFPAAYPRWYLDGFAQIFSSLEMRGDNIMEFGRTPLGTSAVLEEFGNFPVADVLSDKYLTEKPSSTRWTPIHAWLLTHFLLFSDTRRPQLNRYLRERAQGVDPVKAAEVFGDQKQLAKDLRAYFGARKAALQVRYPADRAEEPVVHRLTEGEAAFVQGRLELGSRVLIPAAPPADADPRVAKSMEDARNEALKARDHWLTRLRSESARWPHDRGAQLLLAEAECRSGNAAFCLAAAQRAEALAPRDASAMAWHGIALVQQAAAASATEKDADLAAARRIIVAANSLDPDAVMPLLAYYDSFAAAGQPPSVAAIDGVQKAMEEVPSAPETRVKLASALVDRNRLDAAREVVLPVAVGAYDTPERSTAQNILARTGAGAASPPPSAR